MSVSHNSPAQSERRPASGDLHPALYLATAIAVAWIILVVGISFFALASDDLPLGIIAYFSLIAFGVPALLWRVSPWPRRKSEGGRFRDWVRQRVEIHTGPIGAKQAALQVLLIPGSAVVTFTALAVIEVVEHGGVS